MDWKDASASYSFVLVSENAWVVKSTEAGSAWLLERHLWRPLLRNEVQITAAGQERHAASCRLGVPDRALVVFQLRGRRQGNQ